MLKLLFSRAFTPPTVEETLNHPAYSSTIWALEPHSKGKCEVGKGRPGGPLKIAWEIHGEGPTKVAVRFHSFFISLRVSLFLFVSFADNIMEVYSSSWAWPA